MIKLQATGNYKNTKNFLTRAYKKEYLQSLDIYGQMGVEALAAATPVNSGLTASSWSYDIKTSRNSVIISWNNSNINNGVPIAIILQYGHGTKNGGYVRGRDYINPAIKPIFDAIADNAWKEVLEE